VRVNLGNALATLGSRESGTARLEEAVAAYRAALEERTRDRVPLQWAMTQVNLGNALFTLGERESGTARLEEAVAAYRAALEEMTRAVAPHWHDIAQQNLAQCFALLEQRRSPQQGSLFRRMADVAVLPDRVRKFQKSAMFFCGYEGPYFAPVVLHASVVLEIGAQLRFLGRHTRRDGRGLARR